MQEQQTTPQANRSLSIKPKEGESKAEAMTKVFNSHVVQSAATLCEIHDKGLFQSGKGIVGIADHIDCIQKQVDGVLEGDLKFVETALVAQAQTLDSLFNLLAQKAIASVGSSLEATERNLRMALKAQNQCRNTLETLAEIKNPRMAVFATQANITSGAQQVNNASPAHGAICKEQNTTNELLNKNGVNHGEWLDTGTQSQTGRAYQAVETVGKINRRTNRTRKSNE